jgi:hypothetical protein
MESEHRNVVGGVSDGAQYFGNGTGTVLPVPNSQKTDSVGAHWLRISFNQRFLAHVSDFTSNFFGDHDQDGRGLWSYDSRLAWASGVSLNYDEDPERSDRVHAGQMTLDIPGGALDQLCAQDQCLLIELCNAYDGKCTRVDIFFDDYRRNVTPHEIYEIAKKGDYSGFRMYNRRERGNSQGVIHDEISFGRRGSFGSGAYLRIYDKMLESNGQFNCVRYEMEFTQKKADAVFKKLAACSGDLEAFATLCGSLVAGSISFVHRTGDKNINRLERYTWWDRICEILGGDLKIRIERKKESVTEKMNWLRRNVSPTLACLLRIFKTEKDFYRWLFDVIHDGDGRMNPYAEQIARDNESSLAYSWGELQHIKEKDRLYDQAMSQL